MSDDQLTESHHIWLREAARDQRRRATLTEQRLWAMLRGRRLSGSRFRRQDPVGPYIADFVCAEAHLIVEIDGSIHDELTEYDAERDEILDQIGYRVLRIPAQLVSHNLPTVLDLIRTACQAPPPPRTGEGRRRSRCSRRAAVGG